MAGLLAAGLGVAPGAASADITGKARAIDGDTLEIAGVRIGLFGIAAPRPGQTCRAQGKVWNCGQDAAFALAFEVAEHWVTCKEKGRDVHGLDDQGLDDQDRDDQGLDDQGRDARGRVIAVCFIGPYDLAARMVGQGWAVADRRVSDAYAADEAKARKDRAGLWRGRFTPPWEWPEKR